MESPAMPVPLDPREQPILENLLRTRDALLLIKRDKSSYVKSRDVLPLYEEVIAEVEKLNSVRKEQGRRLIHNRREFSRSCARLGGDWRSMIVDYILDDCFQLISLLFLTVGKNNEAPAVWVTMSLPRHLMTVTDIFLDTPWRLLSRYLLLGYLAVSFAL